MIYETYATLSSVNATTDMSQLLVYVNNVTNGYAMPSTLVAFFLVVFLGGMFAQYSRRGILRIDLNFAAAGFATFGLAVIMSLVVGILGTNYIFITLGIAILGAIWLYLSTDE